jgi:hypothetical protein
MIVTITDVRKAGYCVRGIRTWARTNGLDFNDFVKNGIEHERLAALGDAMADRVIALKLERENG